ncbi:E3 ubiquitin-protein ligase TRIM45-like [Mytilus edulis]|uniref:E3 ubiquitin-protein ligase TRIM45-like n=1 Tax=Mytilus edulis TaxID=6550 RepID=UPI0039F10A57
MALEKHILCGPCLFDDVTKDAGKWCTNCEEGLCEDCENVHRKGKTTRNHKVISINDYHKIEHVSISQTCVHHGENLEWFCKSHDEVLCIVCVPSKHKACSDVIPISANSANSRQSTALSDLEETIEGSLRKVKQCIKNRESATKEIEKQEQAVKTMVLETRTKINGQLDRLQEKLLLELRSTSHNCKSKYIKILRKLKSTEEMLTKLGEQTLHMKQFSSDIQVFLGTREVNKQIENEIESIKDVIAAAKDYELKVTVHSIVKQLSKEVAEFGQIRVSERSIKFAFRDPKIDQAQNRINVSTSRNISDIKLQLTQSFQMKMDNEIDITGCVILPNGHLLMASYKQNPLIEYSGTGEHVRDIPVSSTILL